MCRSWSSDVPPTYPQETTPALLAISVASDEKSNWRTEGRLRPVSYPHCKGPDPCGGGLRKDDHIPGAEGLYGIFSR